MSKKNRKQAGEDKSPHVFQKDILKESLQIRELKWTEKQKQFLDISLNKTTNIILVKGPAGTAKTLLSVYSALKLLNEKKIRELIYIRNPVESSSYGLGFRAGDESMKLSPYSQPLEEKLKELLPPSQANKLMQDGRARTIPVGYLRGSSLCSSLILGDEMQNLTLHDLLLVMTRLGRFSKMILSGDIKQSDIKNGAFHKVYDIFNNEESKVKGIYCFEFDKEDIMRNEILSFIIDKFDIING